MGSPAIAGLLPIRAHEDRRAPGEDGVERAPFTGLAADADLAALRLDDPLGEREAEARAGVALGGAGVELLELDEQPVDVVARDPDPGVLDLEPERVGVLGPHADDDLAGVGREL